LSEMAQSPAAVAELPAWEAILDDGTVRIGGELDPSRDTAATAQHLRIELTPSVTSALLTSVPAAFHAGIDDVLLAALVVAIAEWNPGPLLVDVEGHGRESDRFDLSHTVGWFTTRFPVRLDISGIDREDAGHVLKRVKEQ